MDLKRDITFLTLEVNTLKNTITFKLINVQRVKRSEQIAEDRIVHNRINLKLDVVKKILR